MRDYSGRPESTRMSHYLRTGRLLPANYCAHHKSHHPDYGGADFLAHKSWNTGDFIRHYYFGNGKPVNLANVGLFHEFRNSNSVKKSINEYKNRQIILARQKAGKVCQNVHHIEATNPHIKFSDRKNGIINVTENFWRLFSIGHSTFFRSAETDLYVDCERRDLHLEGMFTFSIDDAFIDARDLDNSIDGNQEFEGGTPFKIFIRWRERFGWKGSF